MTHHYEAENDLDACPFSLHHYYLFHYLFTGPFIIIIFYDVYIYTSLLSSCVQNHDDYTLPFLLLLTFGILLFSLINNPHLFLKPGRFLPPPFFHSLLKFCLLHTFKYSYCSSAAPFGH